VGGGWGGGGGGGWGDGRGDLGRGWGGGGVGGLGGGGGVLGGGLGAGGCGFFGPPSFTKGPLAFISIDSTLYRSSKAFKPPRFLFPSKEILSTSIFFFLSSF